MAVPEVVAVVLVREVGGGLAGGGGGKGGQAGEGQGQDLQNSQHKSVFFCHPDFCVPPISPE